MLEEHKSRKSWMEKICAERGKKAYRNPEDIPKKYTKHMYVVEDYEVLYCRVPKVACSNWKRIMIILGGKTRKTNPTDINKPHSWHSETVLLNRLDTYKAKQRAHILRNYMKFMFVREPMERLYSAYRDKFLKYNETYDQFTPIGKLVAKTYRDSTEVPKYGKDITFSEFVQFVTDPNMKEEAYNIHWEPANSLCHPCLIEYNLIGKYESLDKDSSLLLEEINANTLVSFPERSAHYTHKPTSEVLAEGYEGITPEYLNKLKKKYKADYDIFNYTFPSILQEKIDSNNSSNENDYF